MTSKIFKVLKLEILKPSDSTQKWSDLKKQLRDVRYRVFRLANLAVSEHYLNFHVARTKKTKFQKKQISELNKQLRKFLLDEGMTVEELSGYARTGALSTSITDALTHITIRPLTSKNNWEKVLRGQSSLPTFKLNMAIPVRADKANSQRLQKMESGDVELNLMICLKPYPRVTLKTGKIGLGAKAVLNRLLANEQQADTGYRQRYFEIKEDSRNKKWYLHVCYDLSPNENSCDPDKVVGVDVGYACPVYAAIGHGHARLGWKHFQPLTEKIRSLQRQTMARRRSILRGGKSSLASNTARQGHGRKRYLQATDKLRHKIDNAYSTLNNQLSFSVIQFALNNGAGTIQMENLSGLQNKLRGTFLGERWRYYQLQQFIINKAAENGLICKKVNPRFTSRRCHHCGYIHEKFNREFRDKNKKAKGTTRFQCPECKQEEDADYNAAKNLAVLDIDKLIMQQCQQQGLDY